MIKLQDVHFSYGNGEPVLEGANLAVGPGLTLVLGPNGSGKSTLLKVAAGVEHPDRGLVEIEGHNLWRDEVVARRRLAYISEQPDLTPYTTIRDVIQLVCRLRAVPLQTGLDVLTRTGLQEVAKRSIRELSSGQKRRAVLAAAWIGSPRVVLLDEPLEMMDRAMRDEILSWVDRLVAERAAIMIATHDLEPFAAKATRAVVIGGRTCRQHEPLPADAVQRLAFLESLSRGAP